MSLLEPDPVIDNATDTNSTGRTIQSWYLYDQADFFEYIIGWIVMTCVGIFLIFSLAWAVSSKLPSKRLRVITPLLMGLLGCWVGLSEGFIPALLISALYDSIDGVFGVDHAAGLGVGIGTLLCYFHLGKADFIHV